MLVKVSSPLQVEEYACLDFVVALVACALSYTYSQRLPARTFLLL